jgi:hypothetical protein
VVVAVRDLSCPVSRRYGATLQALEDEYADRGVRFLYVDLTPEDVGWTLGMARDQAELDGTYVRHVDEAFFDALRPQTTTEVFLLDGDGVLRYRGAVDDQYGINFSRPAPRNRFLDAALGSVLAESVPAPETTFAPGCYLASFLAARSRGEPATVATRSVEAPVPSHGS